MSISTTMEYWAKHPIDKDKWTQITIIKTPDNNESMFVDGVLQRDEMLIVETETFKTEFGEYYSVQVNGRALYGDYKVWEDMIVWASDTFGPSPSDGIWTKGARWYVNNARFWFKDKKDLEWFMIRWS